jgi:hypothetical protein
MNFLTTLFLNFLSSDEDQARLAEEAFLAESSDLWDLEYRQRELDRQPADRFYGRLFRTLYVGCARNMTNAPSRALRLDPGGVYFQPLQSL